MEEKNEEKIETNKKSRTTNTKEKKEVNSRISDVIQKLEVEGEKEESSKKTSQTNKNKQTIKKQDTTKKKFKEATVEKKIKVEKDTQKKLTKEAKVTKNNTKSRKENKATANKKESTTKKEKAVINKENKISNKKVKTNNNEELVKIEEEISKQKQMPKEIIQKLNKKIFGNLIIAVIISIYLIFIILGYTNINTIAFITDLQVFSISLIITTIIIFEKAYKKDSGKLTIHGIEVLILAIITMLLPRVYNEYKDIFVDIVGIVATVYVIYYIIKSIIIYVKMRKKIRKSDVKKIAKK